MRYWPETFRSLLSTIPGHTKLSSRLLAGVSKNVTAENVTLNSAALVDWHVMAGIVTQVNLPRTSDLLFRVEQQLFPLRNPAGGARDGKQHREHGHREAHGLVYEPGIEVHVRIEFALYEVIVFQRDALALQSDFQQRIFAH